MQVICLEEEAFYTLVEHVVDRLKEKKGIHQDKWISDDEAKRLLNIKAKSTLQRLRDEGKIRFTRPQPRIILYDRDSINEYLEQHARETF